MRRNIALVAIFVFGALVGIGYMKLNQAAHYLQTYEGEHFMVLYPQAWRFVNDDGSSVTFGPDRDNGVRVSMYDLSSCPQNGDELTTILSSIDASAFDTAQINSRWGKEISFSYKASRSVADPKAKDPFDTISVDEYRTDHVFIDTCRMWRFESFGDQDHHKEVESGMKMMLETYTLIARR
jgi:hypothetical protein